MANRQQLRDSDITKKFCIAGLAVSWIVGVGSLLIGVGLLVAESTGSWRPPRLDLTHTWREVIPLLLNVVVTLLNESMGYIHTCTLRWSLQREGRLEFNSNLRLLTASRFSRPNGWFANLTHIFGIVFSYGSTSLIFLSLNPDLARLLAKDHDQSDTTGMHINNVALVTLGVGIILQASIATWALLRTNIPTWSSNPLDVVRACAVDVDSGHRVDLREGRCMMGVDMTKNDAVARRPTPRQKSILGAKLRVHYILALLFAVPLLSGVWGGVILAFINQGRRGGVLGRSWSLLPVFTGITDTDCVVGQCTDGTSVLNVGWSASNGTAGTAGGVFVIAGFQSVISLSLHCAELIVNLSRDEEIYRELIGPRGTNPRYSSIYAALTSWQTLFLFALKAAVHWVFGLAINLQYSLGVNMYPPQVLYLACFTLVALLLGLHLSLRRPRGHLPVSYGHLQTIADIIDEWADSNCMFWGEKDPGDDTAPGFTGTSTNRLPEPAETRFYGGVSRPQTLGSSRGPSMAFASTQHRPIASLGPTQAQPSPLWDYHGQGRYPSQNSLNSAYSGQSRYSGSSSSPFLPRGY
ncbi:hypothetical protein OQA88_5047 [Cercophora sp. LCS_1]